MASTFRALKELKVGYETRNYHDLVPEAADWENLPLLIRESYVEKVEVPQSELDAFVKARDARERARTQPKKRVVKRSTTATKKRVVIRKNQEKKNGSLIEESV